MCNILFTYAKKGQITVNKVVKDTDTQEVIDDNTDFSVTITGQRSVNPKIEEKTFSQDSPAVFDMLPYDTYVITEEVPSNIYSQVSIVPNNFMLWGGNKSIEVLITNFNSRFTPISFGLLYNWYAATDVRGIAPAGWHVPTKAEWETLKGVYGGWSLCGGPLKETGLNRWLTPNTGATNSSGFTGVGGGVRTSGGVFALLKASGYYHSSDWDIYFGTPIILNYNETGSSDKAYPNPPGSAKIMGQSIRLIKDNSTDTGSMTDYDGNVYPTVKIGNQVWMATNLITKHYNNGDAITNITDNTAWAALTTGAWCYYNNDSSYQ